MYLVLFVLCQPEKLKELLEAWEDAGVSGVTILTSTGLGKLRQNALLEEDLPLIPSIEDLFRHEEISSRTLFTAVEDETMVDRLVEITRGIVGDFGQPNSGILIVTPVSRVYGIKKNW
ncbi:MAG: P-II family nitrogen regulator [Anaerolineae bacterium]|nr:P-II family nitrogen regulator [Anaerolineae bacterium]